MVGGGGYWWRFIEKNPSKPSKLVETSRNWKLIETRNSWKLVETSWKLGNSSKLVETKTYGN